MLIAALLVGLLTAYYFGLRPGMIAAGATAALFLVAMVAPGLAIFAYGAVGVGVGAVCVVGPKLRRKSSTAHLGFAARAGLGQLVKQVQKLRAQSRKPPPRS